MATRPKPVERFRFGPRPPRQGLSRPNPAKVVVPLAGFTVQQPPTAQRFAECSANWAIGRSFQGIKGGSGPGVVNRPGDGSGPLFAANATVVDSVSDVVTFPGKGTTNVAQADAPGARLSPGYCLGLSSFQTFSSMACTTLCCRSSTFPTAFGEHIRAGKPAVPGKRDEPEEGGRKSDLCLSGSLAAPIEVTASASSIAPSETAQFKLQAGAAAFSWEINRDSARFLTGLYTAPASITEAQVIVATAISKSIRASLAVPWRCWSTAVGGGRVAVARGSSLVTPGRRLHGTQLPTQQQVATVDWTLSPNVH